MHWTWVHRGRDIESLLDGRFGTVLPDDDAGLDAAALIAQHYMRFNVNPEHVTKANLRLRAPWLGAQSLTRIILVAKGAKSPSAALLGRQFRVTAKEVAEYGLTTIQAVTVTQEGDRVRQDRRRRKAGVGTKRGRPSLNLSPEEMRVRQNERTAARMRALRKKRHAPSYIGETKRDAFCVTPNRTGSDLAGSPKAIPAVRTTASKAEPKQRRQILFGEIIPPDKPDGVGFDADASYHRTEVIKLAQRYERDMRAMEMF